VCSASQTRKGQACFAADYAEELLLTSDAAEIAQFAGGSAGTLSVVRRALAERRSAASVSGCSNGTVETIGAGNPSAITIDTYYDPGCTSLQWVGQFEFNETSSSSGTLTGSYTYYTAAGTVYEYVSPAEVEAVTQRR
jgi:hypothetical protein